MDVGEPEEGYLQAESLATLAGSLRALPAQRAGRSCTCASARG